MNDLLTPLERRQQRTRELILSTALELIKEQGIDKWSLRELARRIDYSPSGIYEYFDSKDNILETLWAEISGRFRATLTAVPTDLPPLEYLLELGSAYIRFSRDYPDYLHIGFSVSPAPFGSFTELDDLKPEPNFMILVHGVRRAIDAGIIETQNELDDFEISYAIWSMIHGMSLLQSTYLSNVDTPFEEVARKSLIRLILGRTKG